MFSVRDRFGQNEHTVHSGERVFHLGAHLILQAVTHTQVTLGTAGASLEKTSLWDEINSSYRQGV